MPLETDPQRGDARPSARPETLAKGNAPAWRSRLSQLWNARHRVTRALLSPPPRQVFVREGVRYVPHSPRRQLGFAAAGFFGLAALLVVVFAYLMQSSQVDALSVALAESQASNQFLLQSMKSREGNPDSLVQDLENDIAAVTKLAEQTRAFQDDVAAAQSRSRNASAEDRAKLATMQDAASRHLQELDTALRTMQGRGSRLKSSLAGIETGAQTQPAAHGKGQAQAVVYIDDLDRRMASLQASQKELLARLADSASINIGRAERAIRVSGIDLDKLLGDMTNRKAGRGGPFVPLAPEAYAAASIPNASPMPTPARSTGSRRSSASSRPCRWQPR